MENAILQEIAKKRKAKIEFFPYNSFVLVDMGETYELFETVSEAVNYCNENNIEAEVPCL